MEVLRDFEETLTRLIENQEALNQISSKSQFLLEKEALVKTQESLKAHIIFLSDLYPKEKPHLKRAYLQEQCLLKKFSYLKQISSIEIPNPFTPPFHIRNHRLKKRSLL